VFQARVLGFKILDKKKSKESFTYYKYIIRQFNNECFFGFVGKTEGIIFSLTLIHLDKKKA